MRETSEGQGKAGRAGERAGERALRAGNRAAGAREGKPASQNGPTARGAAPAFSSARQGCGPRAGIRVRNLGPWAVACACKHQHQEVCQRHDDAAVGLDGVGERAPIHLVGPPPRVLGFEHGVHSRLEPCEGYVPEHIPAQREPLHAIEPPVLDKVVPGGRPRSSMHVTGGRGGGGGGG